MNSPIGFTNQAQQARQQEDEVKSALDEMHKESHIYKQLESRLRLELNEVKHIEHNIHILEKQLSSVEKIMKKRDKLVSAMLHLVTQSPQSIDEGKGEKYLQHINELNSRIYSLLTNVHNGATRHVLDDTHKIVAEEKDRLPQMQQLSVRASEVVSRTKMLHAQLRSFDNEIKDAGAIIDRLARERRYKEPTKVSGFGN